MRKIESALRRTYAPIDGNNRESRILGFVRTGTWSIATSSFPAWMTVSSVYVNLETTRIPIAASRLYARKPDVVSGTDVDDAWRTTHEPSRWSSFFMREKCSMSLTWRSPITMSASPRRIGSTSLAISGP